ncbi:alpha/beta fold hydrolase [Amycolatopsis jiangsuensis]|uniref:Pimeloyl-ACP methyl ester carboxylesterase n=1 Tax=Amycolatopsis jiangsuensis TaxID=1181879 RepID=A0A840IYY7_9PSEU|nr:alpha/beta fold hydrolase [Amycolatopsis jiangsuensis]MBB4686507.1 pimeloyl-ACP methyl ester carboxylesterase [Amycolatopsis jiangsuensis]
MPTTFTAPDGLPLSYTVWEGDGRYRRPVVLHHGFAADADVTWVRPGLVDTLVRAGFTVIALDARGHGASGKPHDPAVYGEAVMAADVSALLDELELPEVCLAGYSMGAIVSLLVASNDRRVRCLAVGGVGAGIVDFGGVDARELDREQIAAGLLAQDRADVLPAARPFRRLARRAGADVEALAAVLRAPSPGPIRLSALSVPTLVLAGESDQLAAEPERLAAAIAGARLVRVPGDHMAAVAHPAFATALADFFAYSDTGEFRPAISSPA